MVLVISISRDKKWLPLKRIGVKWNIEKFGYFAEQISDP